MVTSPASPRRPGASASPITGSRVAAIVAGWLVVAWLAAPNLGRYYEARASFYLVPPLVPIYASCLAHRRRATALLALVVTLVVVLAIGLALVIPKASAALAP